MKTKWMLFLAASLIAVSASAQKVEVDWDRNADVASYKTFAWKNTSETSVKNPLMHSRIKNAIEDQLTQGGLIEDSGAPDLYVTYHGSTKNEVVVNTTSFGYGYGRGWGHYGGGGMGSSTSTVHNFTKGTLIIDIFDAKTKNLVWRGTISDTLSDDAEKNAKKVRKGVEKLAKKWNKKYEEAKKKMMQGK